MSSASKITSFFSLLPPKDNQPPNASKRKAPALPGPPTKVPAQSPTLREKSTSFSSQNSTVHPSFNEQFHGEAIHCKNVALHIESPGRRWSGVDGEKLVNRDGGVDENAVMRTNNSETGPSAITPAKNLQKCVGMKSAVTAIETPVLNAAIEGEVLTSGFAQRWSNKASITPGITPMSKKERTLTLDAHDGQQDSPSVRRLNTDARILSVDRSRESPYINGKLQNALLTDWYQNRKDATGKSPSDVDYNPRTLYVPPGEYKKMTPGQQQYWQIKAENMDCVLFFKMGKFYELFDEDAQIGVKELNLNLMGKERLHAGFPEAAFDKYAEKLVHLGYKIARVEQTETVNAQKERVKGGGDKSKLVKRDMCSVLTPGTLMDAKLIGSDNASFLFSLCEDKSANYGVCVVDAASALFRIAFFEDDASRSKLRTIIASLKIEEILFPADGLSDVTLAILRRDVDPSVWERKNPLKKDKEFWSAATTLKELRSPQYYVNGVIPKLLQSLESDSRSSQGASLALSAIGGTVWYLRRVLLDTELISIGNFELLDSFINTPSYLELDASSLQNLEILQSNEGAFQGSLLHLLDCTQTAFGKRDFKKMVSRPLCDPVQINLRLDAVADFISNKELMNSLRSQLKKLPDLERLLARIHALGVGRDKDAVMYSNVAAKNIKIFVSALNGFEASLVLMREFHQEKSKFSSQVLLSIQYPEIDTVLAKIKNSFNQEDVVSTGVIIPSRGIHSEYDEVQDRIDEIKLELAKYLSDQQRALQDRTIKFFDKQKEPYQLEIAKSRSKHVPASYTLLSSTKSVNRYWTEDIRLWVQELQRLEERIGEIQADISRSFFTQFDSSYDQFMKAISILSQLDCLMTLAIVSSQNDGPMCRPQFVEGETPVLKLTAARHPSVAAHSSKPFVANDLTLGGDEAVFVLVTGPNMGGKSTMLRQTCICVILAQLGCYVPAEECIMTPVDRIFTRIGAHDRILSGQSTFFVELEETAKILRHSTRNSLVILDELGRGTSTFDGTAIAFAVIQHISRELRCRCLFSTHYHILTEEFQNDPLIAMYHMSYLVNPQQHSVIFLYRFVKGICSHSHGMNVARMAGLSETLIESAMKQSNEFELLLRSAHQSGGDFEKVMMAVTLESEVKLQELYNAH